MDVVFISARDIPESFFRLVAVALDKGRRSEVQHGSTGTVGVVRCQFDYALVTIAHPLRA